jgi:hypothetical protein
MFIARFLIINIQLIADKKGGMDHHDRFLLYCTCMDKPSRSRTKLPRSEIIQAAIYRYDGKRLRRDTVRRELLKRIKRRSESSLKSFAMRGC